MIIAGDNSNGWHGRMAPAIIIAALLLLCVPPIAANEVTAGVAKVTFDLPAGVPLAGYSRRHGGASQGTHDPVGVRALVIRGAGSAVALVSCDLLIIDEILAREVNRRVQAARATPIVLFIAATHTHSGPGAYGKKFLEKISMGHYDPDVFEAIVAAITDAILKAGQQLKPVTIGCASAFPQGLIKNRVNEAGFADNQLSVCVFEEPGAANPLAIVVNFAAHPTTLGAWHKALSADYPGVVVNQLEERLPGATALFFAGAVGDQAPVKSGDGFERASFIGQPLAETTLKLLPEIKREPPTQLAVSQERLPLPKARVRLSKRLTLPRIIGQALVDNDADLSVAIVGQIVWMGVPCDLSSELGKQLKDAAAGKGLFPIIAGFTNDYIGYCMPESIYKTGEYEALMAFNGPETGQRIADRLVTLMNQLSENK